MKKFLLFAAIATLFTVACNKKDSAPEAPSLIHKWSLVSSHYLEMDNGTVAVMIIISVIQPTI